MDKINTSAIWMTIVFAGLCNPGWTSPTVSNVVQTGTQVGLYEMITIDFDVDTVATNLYWPYELNTPASITPGVGIAVDGLFSNDGWASSVSVPGFYFQNYTRDENNVIPEGAPHWRIRFAPTQTGAWSYRIRVQDSSGTVTYPSSGSSSFSCIVSSNHGFVGISQTDARYFELSDGTPLLGPGLANEQFITLSGVEQKLNDDGANGVKIVRWWMNCRETVNPFGGGATANGGGPEWSYSLRLDTSGGYRSGDRYCAKVSVGQDTKQSIKVTGGKLYRYTGYLRTTSITGGAGTGAIPYIGPLSASAVQGTTAWTQFSIDYVPATSCTVYVGCKNTGTVGAAYFDDVSVKESSDGGATWSSEYLAKPDFDFQNYIDLSQAYRADCIFEAAKQAGVYLKTVISEKMDFTLGCINSDGSTGARSDSNFYASDSHPSRWLQKAWWRYMTARWGCHTSLHSWELCNEGDPFNGNHYGAANAMASRVHGVYPRRVLCTTSLWHSVPMDFWKSSECDYIDLHEYTGPVTSGTHSHGPRYYAWYDPYTAADESSLIPTSDTTGIVSLDTSTSYGGARCCKVTAHDGGGSSTITCAVSGEYHVGIDPAHTYTLRYKAKAQNVSNAGGDLAWTRPQVLITWSAAYHENDFIGEAKANAPLGTYDWQTVTSTGLIPPSTANTANLQIRCTRGLTGQGDGMFWVDDIEFIDEATGQNLFVDGGFEGDRIDYDTALGVKKYGILLNSYGNRIGKPGIWAETGVRGPNIYGSPYNDYYYTDENQKTVDDLQAIYVKKMIWSHAGPDNPNMLLWWTDNVSKKNKWNYFKAFQAFMSGVLVSNGHYTDANAQIVGNSLRAWGQKDLTNNRAHLWIDNAPYTWKNVVDGVSVPPASGTVTVSGLANGTYYVDWWDTSTGAITRTDEVVCAAGDIVLSVNNLQSDVACKIYPKPARIDLRILVPSADVIPGQIVTVTVEYTNSGETDASNVSISARVPAEMQYVSGSAEASGGVWNSTTQSVSWVLEHVAAHQTGTKTFNARVN